MSESSEDEYTKFEIESNTSERSRVEYVVRDLSDVVGRQQAHEDRQWPKTIALFGGFFSLGLVIAILGPTIPDLLYQIDASYDQLSYIFLSRGFGYMTGSIISGVLFERFNAFGLLGTFLVTCSFGLICVPATKKLSTIMISFVVSGTAMGGLDTGGNVLCLRIWGESSPPYMQALHFTFAIGACAAPLIARPFIGVFAVSPGEGNTTVTTTEMAFKTDILESTSTQWEIPVDVVANLTDDDVSSYTVVSSNFTEYTSAYNDQLDADVNNNTRTIANYRTSMTPKTEHTDHGIVTTDSGGTTVIKVVKYVENPGNIFIVYGIISAIALLTSLAFYYFCLIGTGSVKCRLRCRQSVNDAPLDNTNDTPHDRWFRIQMLSILFVFYFLYVGGEVAFGSYIYSYAINCDLKFSKDSASILNSLFWGSFAVFRGFAIILAYVFTPLQMLMADVIVCIGASVVLVLFANSTYLGIWSGTAMLGAAMASLFPTGLSWLERYIHVTGNDAAILVVGASFGEMIIPFAVGQYFPDDNSSQNENENIDALMYLVLLIACLTFVLFLIAYKLASRKGDRYSKNEVSHDALRETPMVSL